MKSIIQKEKKCWVCGDIVHLHEHHIFFGKNRKNSEEDGMKVWLCLQHHTGTSGVHGKNGHRLDYLLKQYAENKWKEYYNRTQEDFIKRYGKNYL